MFDQYKGLRKELYVIVFGRVVTNMGAMVHAMMTMILNQKMGMNASEVAIYFLAINIICVPMNVIGGKLADKFNKRNIIIVCDIISIIAYTICFFIKLNYFSIVLISIASLFQQVERPTYDAIVADFTLPKDRTRAFSLSYLGSNLGYMLAPTIAGLLFNKHLNLVFLISAFAIACSTLLIYFLIKDVSKEESILDNNEYEKELDNSTNTVKYILNSRVLTVYVLSFVTYCIIYNQFNYLLPLELAKTFNDRGSLIYGTMSTFNCIECFTLTIFITRIFNHKSEIFKSIHGVFFIIGAFALYLLFSNSVLMCYFSMLVFTLGEITFNIGNRPYQTKRIPSNYRGRVLSFIFIAENVSVSITNLIIGRVYDNYGSFVPWLIIFVIGAICLALTFYLKVIDKKEYPNLYTD